ncbi:MAG TPA: hypothetical protein VFD92_27475 [Candidatus Binatia bacterium]|nr:hypothetical protein [Candidatus Binatia bacterium]
MNLRRFVVALGLVALVSGQAAAAGYGNTYTTMGTYNDGESHPLRLLSFAIAPAAFLAEWLVTRPIFRLVSQQDTAPIFSYTPQAGFDYETYQEGLSTGVTFEDPQAME